MALGVEKRFVVVVLALFGALQVSIGAVYKVGDSAGWTTIGNVDYKTWAAIKSFQLGDIIRFEYSPQFHNVMQVSHVEYRACNATAPIATHTTGNDSITISARGHHYFLCGVPGHCQAGQKVDINVPRVSASSKAPTPSALSNNPSATHVPVPSPSAAAAAPSSAFKGPLAKLGFAMAVLASIFA